MNEILDWIKENGLDCQINGNLISIKDFGNFYFLREKDGKIISDEFLLILDEEDEEYIETNKDLLNYVVFRFGNEFYYSKLELTKNQYNELAIVPKFNDFLNLGRYSGELDEQLDFVNLAIHTGYELLNGSGEPSDYIQKAKFFRQTHLGICELDTLGSSLPFQLACKKNHIKPIIGESISVAYDYVEGEVNDTFELKLFVKNNNGWRTLLNISKIINVDFDKLIPIEKLSEFQTDDLICVISTNSFFNFNIKNKSAKKELFRLRKIFGKSNLYYQIDLSEFSSDEYDLEKLDSIKNYIGNFSTKIKPVYIQDTYVVEKKNKGLKTVLNNISRKVQITNEDCYLKSVDEIFYKNINLFDSSDYAYDVFVSSLRNSKIIAKECENFEIEIGKPKLPEFKTDGNKLDFYYDLIEKGFIEKIMSRDDISESDLEEYIERIKTENEIIIGADIVDYFLILWDIVEWCKKEGILVGIARGSAGGSLIAYLLSITEIDPIKHNLLFERFLNKTRTMPEIQYDLELEDGSKYMIPEDFYDKNVKGLKNINPELIKEFLV